MVEHFIGNEEVLGPIPNNGSIMMNDKNKKRIEEIEEAMMGVDFWNDKDKAQAMIAELQDLKAEAEGLGKYDRGGAHITFYAGAGGDDSEDFVHMLLSMYTKYIESKGWQYSVISESPNDHGGYKNITIEINGKNVYGNFKYESGVHRLVRISPFNAKSLRHTSFAMVEVIPKFDNATDYNIPPEELEIEFTKVGGPGGQNVNKRETAVRITHKPTGLTTCVANERSQLQNREKALEIIKGKVYNRKEEERIAHESGMHISKTTDIEWGNQIRSYVLHPYKMIKDHRTDTEIRDINKVLDGDLDPFIQAMKLKQ